MHYELLRRRPAQDALADVSDLARALLLPRKGLCELAENTESHYIEIRIPKRHGGLRRIHAPDPSLKKAQRAVLRLLEDRMVPKSWMHGGVTGRSIVTHAAPHCGRCWVAVLDLADFFPSVRRSRVQAILEAAGFTGDALKVLLALTTLGGALPQGAPTSSHLANLALFPLDRRLRSLARRWGLTYSRYLDDIALSGKRPLRPLKGPLHDAVIREGFRPSPSKTAFMGRHEPQVVTGLLVNDRLRPVKSYRRALVEEVEACRQDGPKVRAALQGISVARYRSRILGRIRHWARFDAEKAERLERRFRHLPRPGAAARETDGREKVGLR
ncbi:MAG TPA: RNA-directed DNA polymerase [Planctomycetes bacterium]|nr:RNA-directed DNA polymerase [Planctomycetota bacterium]